MGCCTERWFYYLWTLWLYGWVGFFPALNFFCIFLMGKMILKYIIMNVVAPKQEECLGGSCILIPAVTTFHNNIRHRPKNASVQAAESHKWIMVYFLATYSSLTTWLIIISMKNFISISIYCLGLLSLFLLLAVLFLLGFKSLLSHSFWLFNSARVRDLSALRIFYWMNKLAMIQDFTCSKFFNFKL